MRIGCDVMAHEVGGVCVAVHIVIRPELLADLGGL